MVALHRSAIPLPQKLSRLKAQNFSHRGCLKPTPCIHRERSPNPSQSAQPLDRTSASALPQLGQSLALEGAIASHVDYATIARANAAPPELCYPFLSFEAETYTLYGLNPVTTSTRTE
jgi:hypothetical protein